MSDQQAQELRGSSCCGAEVRYGGGQGATKYYVCCSCEKACDVVQVERPDEPTGPELNCPTCGYRCHWPICTKCGTPTPQGPWSMPARLPERPDEGTEREWKAEDGEPITRAFHDAYERLAPTFGYKTREASAVAWEDVPAENKGLMRATIAALLCEGVILPGPLAACHVSSEENTDAGEREQAGTYEVFAEVAHFPRHCEDSAEKLDSCAKLVDTGNPRQMVADFLRGWADEIAPVSSRERA